MKAIIKFFIIFAAIILAACVLSPLLFKILPFKFERIFNRIVMIGSLLSLFVFVRWKDWDVSYFGLRPNAGYLRFFGVTFLSGLAVLGTVTAIKLALGDARWAPQEFEWAAFDGRLINAFFAALLIGLIEEFFFRGVVFGTLRERSSWPLWPALVVTNLFYAIVHFVNAKKPFIGPDPGFGDSLKLVAAPLKSLEAVPEFWPAALGLFLFGLLLNFLFLESKTLYPSMGFHAGCVFYQKMEGVGIFYNNQYPLLLGTSKAYDGLLGWLMIGTAGYLLILKARRFRTRTFVTALLAAALVFNPAGPLFADADDADLVFSKPAEEERDRITSDGARDTQMIRSPAGSPSDGESISGTGDRNIQVSDDWLLEQERKLKALRESRLRLEPQSPVPPPEVRETVLETEERETAKPVISLGESVPDIQSEAAASARVVAEEIESAGEQEEPLDIETRFTEAAESARENVSGVPASGQNVLGDVANPASEPAPQSQSLTEPETADTLIELDPTAPVFYFTDYLSSAKIWMMQKNRSPRTGKWDGVRFYFPGMSDTVDIRRGTGNFEGVEHAGIAVRLQPDAVYRLRFPSVPPGSQLVLNYGIDDAFIDKRKIAHVYARIWAGSHLIDRLVIPNEKGWRRMVIDLGVLAFLKEPVTITWDLTTDDPETGVLILAPELQKTI